MKVCFALDTPAAFQSGIWFHRNEVPSTLLQKRGHAVKQIPVGQNRSKEILEWADTVVLGRTYPIQLLVEKLVIELKKAGKRILYDMDDDFWTVAKHNPSALVSNAFKDQYELLIKESDGIITPSEILAKKFKKLSKGKPVYICPNCASPDFYKKRPHAKKEELSIGYMGAASHWEDLQMITKALNELYKKYPFSFDLYGLTAEPLESAMYFMEKAVAANYPPEKIENFKEALKFYDGIMMMRGRHYPFMPPELHPTCLSRCDFDIGLAPLTDTEFNRGKSDIKFQEYVNTGTACLASKIESYTNSGVGYYAKNDWKDWRDKIEKLIVDEKFREELYQKQKAWIDKYRSPQTVGIQWELACQRPGGLKVANQQLNEDILSKL